ncbi:MAG TPA: redox-sensing transcriptional repressor Rex [Dehalococcoidia bacterium]|jgi:redox-sensing transcriptional repressor|nr:redox-sensing transcriptional repressor Rex [Dehalococcoidia bacterium]
MEIPPVVIDRLPLYARALASLESQGREVVSSQELGHQLSVTPAQIRKDLSYFGRFGKQGRGYNVRKLLEELRRILGLNRQWRMALVGTGRLGRAILGYEGFGPQGFNIVEAFDSDTSMIGSELGGLTVHDTADLEAVLDRSPVDVGIVAVPAETAQDVIDRLVKCGVRAILNYAPIAAHVPRGVQIKRIDPVLSLQGMTYYLKAQNASAK